MDSKTRTYANRTKFEKCGGSETVGPKESVSDLSRRGIVRRVVREARGYWRIPRARTRRRMFVVEGMAEGEELGSNILRVEQRSPAY